MQVDILGIPVTFLRRERAFEAILEKAKARKEKLPYFIITANPEFLLHAREDEQFRQAMRAADLVLPDGVALAQARYFLEARPQNLLQKLSLAGIICLKTIKGDFHQDKVTGVTLVKELLKDERISLFLLGGRDGVGEKVAQKYQRPFFEGPTRIKRATKQENEEMIEIVKEANPDVLLVSFGHFSQEIWIHEHLQELTSKVVIGVGSTFDELSGHGYWAKEVPGFFEKAGLKWLWRLLHDRSHAMRVWRAVVVFPLTVAFSS